MPLPEPWHIKSRSRQCALSERPFDDGEAICTALFRAADGSFERLDFSLDGWEQRPAGEDPPPFSFWRSTYQAPETAEKPQVVEKESAEDLLKRLIEEDEEHTENVRYILAVMLERQKLLRETDRQRTPNGILRVYEHRKTGEVMIIRDPNIPLDEVEQVQGEVIAMIESGGRPPQEPAAADDSPAEPDQATEQLEQDAEPAEQAPAAPPAPETSKTD